MTDSPTIAFLATGDEITCGDILNTNAKNMALKLKGLGFAIGSHVIANDQLDEIMDAILFLLKKYRVLIITGGLGPTSDDKTRFALANATQKKLITDDASWQHILNRLAKFKLFPHESNRQQTLFPEGAVILPNANGTANGCFLNFNDSFIFMLPGPPQECLPMFENFVLPDLMPLTPKDFFALRYRAFGVSEGEIASKLDEALAKFSLTTGYRWDYPYLECKIFGDNVLVKNQVDNIAKSILEKHIICTPEKTASELLADTILQTNIPLYIEDFATKGNLLARLIRQDNYFLIHNTMPENFSGIIVKINGLSEYWLNNTPEGSTTIQFSFAKNDFLVEENFTIPYRHSGVMSYAVEWISCQIIKAIRH